MGAQKPPSGEMDHEFVQGNQIPDRYRMGKLSAEERLEFEEHFIDCPICLDHLESLEGLRVGLIELSGDRMAAFDPGRSALARLLRGRRTPALLAAACLVLAVLPAAFFFGELRRTRGELESVRRSFDEAQRDKTLLTQVLEGERAAGASAAAPLAASVFTLNVTRGAATEGPDNRIVLRDAGEWVILLLDRPDRSKVESYRARISTADRSPIGDALTASAASGDMLAVGLPPGLLSAGDYVLTLEGLGAGPPQDLASYRFRAVLRK